MKPEIANALHILESEPDNADALAQLAAAAEGGGNGKSDPAAERALSEARRVHRERGDFELVVRLCDLELGWEKDPSRRADLLYEKGRLLTDELLRESEAEAAFQKVLAERPGDEGATEALAHIALVRDAWQKIVKKYLDEAKGSSDRQLTTSLYVSVAEIYWKYQPGAQEIEGYLRKALDVEPRNRKAAQHLERLYRAGERWQDLAALYEARVEATATKDEKVALYAALAEVQRERMKRPDLAVETMRRAIAVDPAHPKAMHALVDAYTAEENWHGLLKVYENALKARRGGGAEGEIAILIQLGMVWWKKLANADSAEPYFAKVRKVEPAHPLMLTFYRAYHGERNEPTKLLAVLGQAQKVERDPRRRMQLSVEMAEVAEASAGNVEKAIDIWKGVLKQQPGAPEAVAALKRLYQRSEKWNALLELLKEQIDALPKDTPEAIAERVSRLGEVVAIYRDRLNLDVMVINTFNTILALQPDNVGALDALAAKYEAMGRWNDLIGVLQRKADAASDVGDKARLLRRIAGLWIEKFGNHNQAVKPLEELYALAPTDGEAVTMLRDIYTRRRAWRALLDLERKDLERRTGADRRQKLVEMAKLAAERLGDAPEAIALWNRLLEDDPDDGDALVALASLYEREKRWAGLVEVLRRQRARASDNKQAVPLLEKIGNLWAERLGAPQKAIEVYQEVVRLMPTHARAVRVLRELFAQAGDFARLEALYAENKQWDELAETLLAVSEKAADPAQKIKLYSRVAEIAQRELKQPERAAKAFERILAVDPQNLAAAQQLVPIYRAGEKWARLLATYEILLGHAGSVDDKLELHRAIRQLCEERLGSKQLAFSWCAKAYELRPDDAALGAELERLAREGDAYEELAILYADQADRVPDGPQRIARYRQLADLLFHKLNRPDEAKHYYREVLARVPEDAEASASLEKIHTQGGDFGELLKIYRARLGAATGPARADLLFKIAWIEEEQSGDLDAAAATYQKVLEVDPSSTRALRALERIYAQRGNSAGLADVLGRQLAQVQANDVESEVALSHQLGEIHELRLGDPAKALGWYQRAFARQPSHKPTLQALERYLAAGSPSRVEVARLLAPVYERADDARRLAEALAILLDAAKEPDEELALLRRLEGLVGRRLGEVEAAYRYAARIFARVPADAEMRRELAELAELLEKHDDHAKLLAAAEEKAAGAGDEALARDLAWELSTVLDERLRDAEGAEAAWRRVLARDPDHDGAHHALERHYRASERYAELRALYAARKERVHDPAEKRDLLFQICDLDEGVLDDARAAAATYAEVLDVDPASQRAFKALERIYTADEKWPALDDLYRRALDAIDSPAERAALRVKRAELHLARLDDARGACDLYEEAVADDPKSEAARKGLEKLMARPELRLRAARLLEPLYEADQAWPRLAQTLLAQREKVEGREAVELLGRIAHLVEEKLGSRQQAFAAWREAMRLDPADAGVRIQVERLAVILDRYPELAQSFEEAEGLADPHDLSLRAELLRKAALIYDEQLGELQKARVVWRRLLDLDPTNLETAQPAAAALSRLYEADEAWSDLIEVLRKMAEWAEPGDPRKEILRKVGVIQEDLLEDTASAVATHREILDGDPEDRPALDALERLHAARGEWAELIDVLRRRVDLASDQRARRDLLWRIAELTEHKLHDGRTGTDVVAAYTALLDENPEDQPTLEALARIYAGSERASDLLETLERQLALARSARDRVALRGRIAQLLEGPLMRPDQALDRYREMLDEEPDNAAARAGLERMLSDEDLRLRAAEVLEPIYQKDAARKGDVEKLIQLSELWAEHAPDPRERIARLRRIAELREGQQPDGRKAAFDALSRAARVAVGESELPSLLDKLEKLAGQAGLRAELIALYRELGADILDATVQERVYLTVASESRALGDRMTAREYFRRVLDASPEHARALDALESLYVEGRELDPLLEIYNRRAELALSAGDEEKRRHYLTLAAKLCEGDLGRPAEAMACWEQILELFPADAEAAKALEALYQQAGRHADLADLLERRMGFADDIDEAVALRFRLGELYEKELADTDRAVENYRAAMGGDPDHKGAIAALERFLDDPNHRVDAAEVLEPVYAGRHDWKSLIKIYEIRLDAADEPPTRLVLTKRIARLYEEQLEDLEAAFRWYGKVFRENPADRAIRDQLARLAQILDRHAELAAVYEDYLQDVFEETPASIEVLRTLAAVHDQRLGDVEAAKKCYLRLLAHDAGDLQAFGLLEQSLNRAQKWQDLLQVYRDVVDNTLDPGRRKDLLFRICHLQQNMLADPEAAIDGYRAVLDLDAEDPRALAALDNLYVEGKKWHDLAELLTRQLERADGLARAELKLRLGNLYEGELQDLPAAIDAYEEVLAHDPNNREAVAALERLILDHDQRFRIAQILEPIYKAHDEWAKLVVIYDAELEFLDDKVQRVDLLKEIARLHAERGGDLKLAFGAVARAWTEEAPEGEAREAPLYQILVELSTTLNAWRELVRVLEQAVDGSYDYDLQARVFARIAEIYDRRMGDATQAIASWRRVTSVREDDVDAWKALERLLGATGRHAELVQVLERRGELSQDLAEQKGLAYRAAELYERELRDPEKAIATWRHVLSLDEDDKPALDALGELYFRRGMHRDLAFVLSRKIELATEERERRPLRFAMAKVFEEQIGDTFEAISAYKAAIDADPRDKDALTALARLYEKEGQWPDLLEAVDALAALAPRGPEHDGMRFRAAKVLEEKENEAQAAIERYRQILDDNPDHGPSRQALEKLVRDEETREAAAAVLDPLYRARGEFQPLIDLTELKLQAESEPSTRRGLLAQLAELYEAGVEDLAGAFAAWGRLLAESPDDEEAFGQLERIAELRSSWPELAALYEARLDAVFDPEVQRVLALKLAELYEHRLSDEAKAITRLEKALELPGEEMIPLGGLDRLLGRASRWRDLADVLAREAQAVTEPEGQAEFLYRLGALRNEQLADPDGAVGAWRDALDREPKHPKARLGLEALLSSEAHAQAVLDILEPLADSDGDHGKRVELAEARLRITDGKPERAGLLQRIAETCERDLRDRKRALAALTRAVAETPEDGALADEAERLGAASGKLPEVAEAYDRVLDAGVPTDVSKELGLRAARLYDQLGDDARAEHRYLGVLDLDGDHAEALAALERIYRRRPLAEVAGKLAEVLDHRADLELDPAEKKKLLAEVARIQVTALGDEQGAVRAWQKVLTAEEGDPDALAQLAALHEQAGRYAELTFVLEQQARHAERAEQRAALQQKMAHIYADRLNQLDRAVDAWREVLDAVPDSPEALAALEGLHARRGDWLAVQEVLVRQLGATPTGRAQVPVYRKLAALAVEHQDAPEDAIGYLQQVVDLVPDDQEARRALAALLEKCEKWYDLVEALKAHAQLAGTVGDHAEEVQLLVRAADVLESRLDAASSATEILETILERDPRNVRALAQLAKIYEAAHDLERCKETLERAVALSPGGADAAELYFRLGHLEEERAGAAAAEAYYQRAFEADVSHPGALAALEKVARERGDWARVAELLEVRSESAPEQDQRAIFVELAKLYLEKVKQPAAALPWLERAAQLAGPDADASILEPLAEGYFAAGRLADAQPIYHKLIDKVGKGRRTKELGRWQSRLGGIAEKNGDFAAALAAYKAAQQIDAGHAPTLAALGRLYAQQQQWEDARRIYRSMLLQNLDPASGVSKADVYLALGDIHERLNEGPKALGMYERGLELDPAHAALKQALARVRGLR